MEEKAVREKLSFTFPMWEENKQYCRLFVQLFCGPGVLSLWFFFREVSLVTVVFEEYKWDEQIIEQKLFLWNTSKNRKLASSSSIYWIFNLLDSNLSTILKMRKFPHRHDFVCACVCARHYFLFQGKLSAF